MSFSRNANPCPFQLTFFSCQMRQLRVVKSEGIGNGSVCSTCDVHHPPDKIRIKSYPIHSQVEYYMLKRDTRQTCSNQKLTPHENSLHSNKQCGGMTMLSFTLEYLWTPFIAATTNSQFLKQKCLVGIPSQSSSRCCKIWKKKKGNLCIQVS